jgi:hypothetical protein
MKRIVVVATIVVAVLAFAWYRFSDKPAITPGEIFTRYYKVDHNEVEGVIAALPPGSATSVRNDQDSLKDALTLFAEGHYDDCARILTTTLVAHPDNRIAQYHLALCHINHGQYAKAAELLAPLAKSTDFTLHYNAFWNAGLCYLKMNGERATALNAFKSMAGDNKCPEHQEADAIVRLLQQK